MISLIAISNAVEQLHMTNNKDEAQVRPTGFKNFYSTPTTDRLFHFGNDEHNCYLSLENARNSIKTLQAVKKVQKITV